MVLGTPRRQAPDGTTPVSPEEIDAIEAQAKIEAGWPRYDATKLHLCAALRHALAVAAAERALRLAMLGMVKARAEGPVAEMWANSDALQASSALRALRVDP